MYEFKFRDGIACLILSRCRRNVDGEVIECRFNDMLIWFTQHVLKVDIIELITKITNRETLLNT